MNCIQLGWSAVFKKKNEENNFILPEIGNYTSTKCREKIFSFPPHSSKRGLLCKLCSLEKNNTNIGTINYSILLRESFLRKDSAPRIRIYAWHPRYICQAICPRSWMHRGYNWVTTLGSRIEKVSGVDKFIKRRLVAVITFSCKYCRRNLLKKKKKKKRERKVDKCFFLIAPCK